MEARLGRNKGFLTLMAAQLISGLGDWLSIVAVITLVGLKWNATPLEVSFIILSLAVPMALLGPFTGTIADRFNRKALMVVSDLVRAVLILILATATSIYTVYICLFATGLLSAVFIPAKNGKLKEVVADGNMKSAMSITSMIDSGTKIAGPLLSGILVASFGTKLVFYIDSATFIISALLIFLLPKAANALTQQPQPAVDQEKASFKEDFLEGMVFIKGNPYLLTGMTVLGISLLILQLSDSQFIVLIRQLTDASPDLFGMLVTGSGLGMFLAGLLLAKKTEYNALLLMVLGVCAVGVSFGMMAILTAADLPFSIIWGPALGFVAGFAASLVFIPFQAAVQTDTPVHMTGRVFGVINSVTTTATIIGPLLGGWLATVIGIIPTFIITASLLVAMSFIVFLLRGKIERGNEHVSESQPGAQGTASS